jgi:hypothetical protein
MKRNNDPHLVPVSRASPQRPRDLVPSADRLVSRSHNAPPVTPTDDQVLRFDEWCRLNAVSPRTGRRILASGDGPVITRLSSHRIGITVRANRAWQESRARK